MGNTEKVQADVFRDQALEDKRLLSHSLERPLIYLIDDANFFVLISVCRSLIKLHGLW